MPHEVNDQIVDRWEKLQAYSDALPEIVASQMDNIDVVIKHFEWLQEEARTGKSIEAVNRNLASEGKKPIKGKAAKEMQEQHIQIATERLVEFRQLKESIPKTVEALQMNIELLNYKLLNTKPVVASASEKDGIQLPTA